MQFSTTVSLFLTAGTMAYASSLSVYQNQTSYTYQPNSSYIGLTQNLKAKCDGNSMGLHVITTCPRDKRLCKELKSLQESKQKLNSIKANTKVLEQLISLPQPTSFDADEWIKSARMVGKEQARLYEESQISTEALNLKRKSLQKQAPSKRALISNEICKKEMELTLPNGYVSFSTSYEANIVHEKEIEVTQYLSIVNRSGIDIVADSAMFYYRSANPYVRPIRFDPWIVSKYEPRPKRRMAKKAMSPNARMADEPLMEVSMAMPAGSAPAARYVDAREYQIDNLELPSTGEPVNVQVISWSTPVRCEIQAYPYAHTGAFQVCSFDPKQQIDSHMWKVKEGSVTLNENARGVYRDGSYKLYTKKEEDIKILRRPIVQKERETGIFGGTVRKKDGFVLILTNKSSKSKTLTVIDRLPASTTDEIKVKLLEIRSDKKVDYKILKGGKIEMNLSLAPKERRKIEILFEISYDKEIKVEY